MLITFFCSAVAVQCLETAFEVSTDDQSLAVPMTLPEIFASATAQVEELPVVVQSAASVGHHVEVLCVLSGMAIF